MSRPRLYWIIWMRDETNDSSPSNRLDVTERLDISTCHKEKHWPANKTSTKFVLFSSINRARQLVISFLSCDARDNSTSFGSYTMWTLRECEEVVWNDGTFAVDEVDYRFTMGRCDSFLRMLISMEVTSFVGKKRTIRQRKLKLKITSTACKVWNQGNGTAIIQRQWISNQNSNNRHH